MSASTRPASVFIAYKREEAPAAELLREALIAEGFNVWWDEDLQCGQAWAEVLDEAVREAACIIVLWSERAVASQWVRHEASQAIARGVYAPCRIELVRLDSPYDRIQATDLVGWDGSPKHGGFLNLIQRVDTLVPAAVPFLRRFSGWLRVNLATLFASGVALLAVWLLATIFLAQQADRREKVYDCSASTELRVELAMERWSSGESLKQVCLERAVLSQDMNLANADLTRSNFSEASFPKAMLAGADLTEAELTGANLSEADLTNARLTRAILNRADLTRAKLGEAYLPGSKLGGAILFGADLTGADLREADLTRANLGESILTVADLGSAVLERASLPRATLTRVDLSEADLTGASLANSDLSEANLEEAVLIRTDLSRTNLAAANLEKADLTEAIAHSADLSGADLSLAKLNRAKLAGAKLKGAILRGTDLTGANLDYVDLAELRPAYDAELSVACADHGPNGQPSDLKPCMKRSE